MQVVHSGAIDAAGIAIPIGIWPPIRIHKMSEHVSEHVRRVAVHVFPRARCGNTLRHTQTTTESRLLVLVLVYHLLLCAVKARKWRKRHERNASAAAPFAREVPRLDLVEAPFLRAWAFFEAFAGCSVGRERHVTERIGARVARPELASRERCAQRTKKTIGRRT